MCEVIGIEAIIIIIGNLLKKFTSILWLENLIYSQVDLLMSNQMVSTTVIIGDDLLALPKLMALMR